MIRCTCGISWRNINATHDDDCAVALKDENKALVYDLGGVVQMNANLDRANIALRNELGTEINYHSGTETHYRAVRMRKALEETK
jgi:hypothetical protein